MINIKNKIQSKSYFQLAIIIIVFAINGSLSAKLGLIILNLLRLEKEKINILFYYLILTLIITIIYPFIIIIIGFIFGQFDFFFQFSKNMLKKMGLQFVFESKKN